MRADQTAPLQPRGLSPKLFMIWDGQIQVYPLCAAQSFGRPSSTSQPDISIPTKVVSRNHGSFLTVNGSTYYTDTASTNGTLYNGIPLATAARQLLNDGDVLRIHGKDDPAGKLDVIMIYSTSYPDEAEPHWNGLSLEHCVEQITVGRKGAVALQDSTVSREHAAFYQAEGGWAVIDLYSCNGVFINNRRIPHPVYLRPMDVIRIGIYQFLFTGSMLIYQSDSQSDAISTIPMRNVLPVRGSDPGTAAEAAPNTKLWR